MMTNRRHGTRTAGVSQNKPRSEFNSSAHKEVQVDEKVLNHVKEYNLSKGYGVEEADIIETIREEKTVWKSGADKHRWWNIYTYVVEINGMFIGYSDAETTGDMSASEAGYEFDPSCIREYEAKEKTVVVYAPKENKDAQFTSANK
jgi:hypothetical protein